MTKNLSANSLRAPVSGAAFALEDRNAYPQGCQGKSNSRIGTKPGPSVQSSARYQTQSRYIALFFLLVLFCLLVFSVGEKSPTADEQNHVARGLAYLRTGDLRLSQEHPPGVNAWEAWPLLLDPGIRLPLDSPSWANAEWYGFADELLWQANDRPQAMIFATRVPVMWLMVLLAALVYRWGRALGGSWGGFIALVLTVFDPNLLAHGQLTTTDMGVTCLSLVAMWALWRALHTLRVERWGPWIVAGLAFGALQLSKFSALVLGPVTLAIVLVEWARRAHPSAGSGGTSSWASGLGRWVLRLLVLYGVAGLVVWAGYGFTWGQIAPLSSLPGPAPAYWSGIASILQRNLNTITVQLSRAHRRLREKDSLRSILDEIPGIGITKRRSLLTHFGSADAVAAADSEELMRVPGIGPRDAQRITAFFLARKRP